MKSLDLFTRISLEWSRFSIIWQCQIYMYCNLYLDCFWLLQYCKVRRKKNVWTLAMGSLFILAVSLQGDGKTEVCWKVTASPLSVRRAGSQTQFPRWDTHKKCVLKLNTQKFIYRGHDISRDPCIQMVIFAYKAAPHGFSADTSRWATHLSSEEETEVFPKIWVLWSILGTYFR